MQTKVSVNMNGASFFYTFDTPFQKYVSAYSLSVIKQGYHSSYDITGKLVIINPSQCGAIEIYEK